MSKNDLIFRFIANDIQPLALILWIIVMYIKTKDPVYHLICIINSNYKNYDLDNMIDFPFSQKAVNFNVFYYIEDEENMILDMDGIIDTSNEYTW